MSTTRASEVVAVAAVARNGVIGAGNTIPWRLPEDLRRFQALTLGHVVVMGRKTFDSIGRPLPDRTIVVVTRDRQWRAAGVHPAVSVADGLALGRQLDPVVFVAGGGEIYRAAWSQLDRLEITEVELSPPGEVTFPVISPQEWRETSRETRNGFAFVSYGRVSSERVPDGRVPDGPRPSR